MSAATSNDCAMDIMDKSGHLTLLWNPDNPESVAKAQDEFDRLRDQGYAFFVAGDPDAEVSALAGDGTLDVRPIQTKTFRPRAKRTVAVRPMRGG